MDQQLKKYLQEKYAEQTIKVYLFDINRYLLYMGKERAENATCQDVLEYLAYLRAHYDNPFTINRILYAVKAWYFYLLVTGKRRDHPCRNLKLKDTGSVDIQLQDLFSQVEMQRLMQRRERFPLATLRNRVLISLLIYQGLRLVEITRLRMQDIDLESGSVFVRSTARGMARTLTLQPRQVMLFYQYINTVRPALLKSDTDRLIITLRGTAEKGEGITYLVETFRHLFPDRLLNPRTLRQSVIANLLSDGKDLRVVQVFAGHKKISSTERYRQSGLKELQAAIEKHHPLEQNNK